MENIVLFIIIFIVCVQLLLFVQNWIRMRQFKNVFSKPETWELSRSFETRFVNGIQGEGNGIFDVIKDSINKYLRSNTGAVIDFGLLKDAVDRHCDSVENEISTQTPFPLYCGLAGTMIGVILGLIDMLNSGAILTLMGSGSGEIDTSVQSAASGINSLLKGVAWAMGASIAGIVLTTWNSYRFKKSKIEEEAGKNEFLAWMQSELLPELPSDISDALNNLVKNLNGFNKTFADNTTNLKHALGAVNESYAIQADIIKAVHDMDVMKMAKANVRVLQELKECTDKLELFNEYLNDIEGYTEAIHQFEDQFKSQADRLYVLEEIRDFFRRHKSEIAQTTADADDTLRKSLKQIQENTKTNVSELHKTFIDQSNAFKEIIKGEKDFFEKTASEIKAQFSDQLRLMPQLTKQLEAITEIPVRIDKLIERIDASNNKLAKSIKSDVDSKIDKLIRPGDDREMGSSITSNSTPSWMIWSGWAALVVIAISCCVNMSQSEEQTTIQIPDESVWRQGQSNSFAPEENLDKDTLVKDTMSNPVVVSKQN